MKIVFLGTSCMVPTKERNHQSIFISYQGTGVLLDCGEGTQRQFKVANLKLTQINKILITHWHGDHVLGLPGLLQSLNASEYEGPLEIYGPKGTKDNIINMQLAFKFNIDFEIKINEIQKEDSINFKDLIIDVKLLEHSLLCLGYSIKEKDKRKIRLAYVKKLNIPEGPLLGKLQNNEKIKWKNKTIDPKDATYVVQGKRVSVILDTLPCDNMYKLSENADLLICEAVYSDELSEKAKEHMHLTAKQAGKLASKSNVKKLVLTHFSQRYKNIKDLENEAKLHFKNTDSSYDFMKLKV